MLLKTCLLSTLVASAAAHVAMVAFLGINDVKGTGMGISDTVSRTSAGQKAQTDTSVIRIRDEMIGATGPCGKTKLNGPIKINEEIDRIASLNNGELPSFEPGSEITLTMHKINEDGAGPFNCDFSTDGEKFKQMQIVRNIPGIFGVGLGRVMDLPLVIKMPGEVGACTAGNNKDTCIVRCRNPAEAGPFGACAPLRLSRPPAAPETPETPAAAEVPAASEAPADPATDDTATTSTAQAVVRRRFSSLAQPWNSL